MGGIHDESANGVAVDVSNQWKREIRDGHARSVGRDVVCGVVGAESAR